MYTILAVDDERWIRMGIVKMIDCEANQISHVFEAGTIHDAIELYHQYHPDIVLTDVCFPAEDGCTLGEYIFRDNPNVKIVMISAYSEFTYAQRALQFRATDYLLKPVSKEKLNMEIARCVQELKQQAEQTAKALPNQEAEDSQNYSSEVVGKIIRRIDQDCAQKISLSQLASEYHISEPYLSHVFKSITGESLTNYVARVRLEKACQMILMGKEKLRDIARHVGYEDYQYFVRVFRKNMGLSPSKYKQNCTVRTEDYDEENPQPD